MIWNHLTVWKTFFVAIVVVWGDGAARAQTADEGACCDGSTGACTIETEAVCEEHGVFLGVGTSCAVCWNDPFGPECATDEDCKRCDTGDHAGEVCITNEDCAGQVSGECVDYGPCVNTPDAELCTVKACCDPETGECTEVTMPDACPTGFDDIGFGSSCDPNCCPQPWHTGADNCFQPLLLQIQVPDLGGDPIQVTTTGDNSAATFDDVTGICIEGSQGGQPCDFHVDCDGGMCKSRECQGSAHPGTSCTNDDVCYVGDTCTGYECEGGNNPGNTCELDRECYPGGVCTPWCGDPEFNPDGDNPDPGWWEAFYIDACAHVVIDFCCTDIDGGPLDLVYTHLYRGCPCSGRIESSGVYIQNKTDYGYPGHGVGPPFCGDDNPWVTFGPLPKGTYYYPVYSAADETLGTYQLHITVAPCPIAACCGDVCVGGSRDGFHCSLDGITECPNGTCLGGLCVGGALDGMPCNPLSGEVIQCPRGECGSLSGCNTVNELVCDAFGGYWLDGLYVPNPSVCGAGVCETGVCCFGPDDCYDNEDYESGCENNGGHYVGGAECDYPRDPCAPCDDRNACTEDFADIPPHGGCLHTPIYDMERECCNRTTGETQPIYDHDPCTADWCWWSTGEVTHPPTYSQIPCEHDADCGQFRDCGEDNMCTCPCKESSSPEYDRLYIEGDTPPDPINQKIRVLSFSAGDSGQQQAIRVTFHEIPPPYDTWEGLQMWVGPLETYCENSGQSTPPPAGCGYPGKDLPLEFAAATLQCTPYYTDWTRRYCLAGDKVGQTCESDDECGGHTCWDGVIHVYHEGIVPSLRVSIDPFEVWKAEYHVQVIEEACSLIYEDNYSPALPVTTSIWGDCVKDLATEPARPPDGSVGVTTDVTGVLEKFKNISGKQPLTSVRADVAPKILDMKIGISDDVTLVLDAFKGHKYPPPPFGDPSDPPCGYVP